MENSGVTLHGENFGGSPLHLTGYCRNFVKINVARRLRQYSVRYVKSLL